MEIWKIKEQTDPAVLDIYIYGDVEKGGYDWWTGEERPDNSAEHFRQELAKRPDVLQINVYINSYGGSVFEGTAIYNQLKRHKAHKTVYIDGFACSIASVIAMAGDEVVMPGNTLMMIHNMWMATYGNSEELRKAADDLDKINEAGRAAYLEKCGDKLPEEELIRMMDAETWLTAEECIKYGLADRLAEQDADLTDAARILQKVNLDLAAMAGVHTKLAAQLRELRLSEGQTAETSEAEGQTNEADNQPEQSATGEEPQPAVIENKIYNLFK